MDTVILSGIILGLTQVAKITIGISKRYVPVTVLLITALVFGGAAYLSKLALDWTMVSSALVVALSAMGMWAGTKATVQ